MCRICPALLTLLVCVSIVSCGSSQPLPGPVLPPVYDNQVVPGVRMGQISLGMTASELLQVMGPPRQENRTRYGFQYHWDLLSATIHDADGRVHYIGDMSEGRFSLSTGLRRYSTLLEVRAKLPRPDSIDRYPDSVPWELWCYKAGLELRVSQGEVISVGVIPASSC